MIGKLSKEQNLTGIQLAGMILWRFGLLLAGGTALYNTLKFAMQFVELPLQLEIGIGFVLAGGILFALSLIVERLVDYRAEGDLSQ